MDQKASKASSPTTAAAIESWRAWSPGPPAPAQQTSANPSQSSPTDLAERRTGRTGAFAGSRKEWRRADACSVGENDGRDEVGGLTCQESSGILIRPQEISVELDGFIPALTHTRTIQKNRERSFLRNPSEFSFYDGFSVLS